jgi:hypothetical protein
VTHVRATKVQCLKTGGNMLDCIRLGSEQTISFKITISKFKILDWELGATFEM